MIQRTAQVTDEYGRPVPGATVYVYNSDGSDATLTLDGTTPVTEPITTDEWGGYSYYAAEGFYREEIWFGGKKRAVDYSVAVGNPAGDVASILTQALAAEAQAVSSAALASSSLAAIATAIAPGALNNATVKAATRAILAGLSTALPAYLAEPDREGTFAFSTANLSAMVTADTAQGIYIAPSSDTTGTSGAWVRKFDGPHNAAWFGLTGDGTTDNLAILNAIKAYFSALPASRYLDSYPGTYRPFPKLWIPTGHYYLSAPFSVDNGTWDIEGEAYGNQNGGNAVAFKIAPGNDGFVIQNWNTTGVNTSKTTRTQTYGAQGTKLKNLFFYTTGAGSNSTACGIFTRTRVDLASCGAEGFPDSGLKISASAGAGGSAEGNANNCRVVGGDYSLNVLNGVHCIGSDANNCRIVDVNCSDNGGWNYRDDSFLGCVFRGCHSATAGFVGSGPSYSLNVLAAVCHYAGNHYVLVQGQATAASTTTPGTNNNVWYFLGTGTETYFYPTWTTGQTWKEGGAYLSTNANSSTVFRDCYGEGDSAPAQLGRGKWDGGIPACGVIGAYISGVVSDGNLGFFGAGVKTSVTATDAGSVYGTTTACLGGYGTNNDLLSFTHSSYTSGVAYTLSFNSFYRDMVYAYAGGGGAIYRDTTLNTSFNPGRAAVVSHSRIYYSAFFGNDNSARQVDAGSAAPSGDRGLGDFRLNNAATAAGPFAWQVTTGGASSSSTSLYAMTAAKGANYVAWTGTANRATKDTASATLVDVAQTVKALIDDLQARGVI